MCKCSIKGHEWHICSNSLGMPGEKDFDVCLWATYRVHSFRPDQIGNNQCNLWHIGADTYTANGLVTLKGVA